MNLTDTPIKNTEITLSLRNPCNYSCDYCIGKRYTNPLILHDMKKLSEIYQSINPFISTVFECGTGEPTLHPQIKEILSLCKQYGTVSIPTNNSLNPKKWLSKDYACAIFINITVHPQAEEKLEEFSNNLTEIKELGATISLRYIACPNKINRFLFLKEYFNKKGFILEGIPFEGIYEGKTYPYSYSESEKKSFGINEQSYWLTRLSLDMKIRNFEGIPCLAGNTFFCISPNTLLIRCLYDDKTPLEEPFKEAQPCKVTCCGCGMLLKELNSQIPNYWNFVRSLSGYPPLETENKSQDQLYREALIIYQNLMKRYNKI